jgi:hypothetical protein
MIVRARVDLYETVPGSAGSLQLDGDLAGAQPGNLVGRIVRVDSVGFELFQVVCRKVHRSLWRAEGQKSRNSQPTWVVKKVILRIAPSDRYRLMSLDVLRDTTLGIATSQAILLERGLRPR